MAAWVRSADPVAGPTTPSCASPRLVWKARTAASVSGPKMPSTLMFPNARWSNCTCLPSLSKLSVTVCSEVVGGPAGAPVGAACEPSARLAVGPTESAASAPIEARLARVAVGTKRRSAARRRARERPSDSSHSSRAARSRTSRAVADASSGPAAGELCTRRGRARAPFVAARARRARERTSEAFQGSATARSRWGPGMDSRPFSFALRLRG